MTGVLMRRGESGHSGMWGQRHGGQPHEDWGQDGRHAATGQAEDRWAVSEAEGGRRAPPDPGLLTSRAVGGHISVLFGP